MSRTQDTFQDAGRRLWALKGRVARLPGAYATYRFVTKQLGEGRVYAIRVGPMRGFRWRRYNSLPYWYHLGLWEPDLSALLAAHLRPGDTYWDIGANAGYHTLYGSRLVGPTGRVLAVEPDPAVAAILREQLALNDITNVTVLEAAVGAERGDVRLALRANNLNNALASVEHAAGDATGTVTVAGTTLDDLLAQHGRPHVIKMDIEGAERLALPAGPKLLGQPPRPRLLLSTHGDDVKAFCLDALRDYGYDVAEDRPGFEQLLVAQETPPRG